MLDTATIHLLFLFTTRVLSYSICAATEVTARSNKATISIEKKKGMM